MNPEKIHIVFGEHAKNTLLASHDMQVHIDDVISLNDDLRIGPIANLGELSHRKERQHWFNSSIPCPRDAEKLSANVAEDVEKIQHIKDTLIHTPEIFIWCGRTTFDRLATARLVCELKAYSGQLIVTDIPEVKFKSRAGHTYIPTCLSAMPPDEVHLIFKYFKNLEEKACKKWMDTWSRLEKENELVRVTPSNGTITSKAPSYFDEKLLSHCTKDFVKAARVVGESLVDIGFEAGDAMLNWRLIHLVQMKKLEFEGELNCLGAYKVKCLP